MKKKLAALALSMMMLFLVIGCNPTIKFESLEEMKEALSEDFYYFEFEGIDFSETGEFSAKKGSSNSSLKGGYFRYTISFEIDNPITGQKNRFIVESTHYTRPYGVGEKYKYIAKVDSDCSNEYKIVYGEELIFDKDNEKDEHRNFALTLMDNENENNFWYGFILERNEKSTTEEEIEFFLSICEPALKGYFKYRNSENVIE